MVGFLSVDWVGGGRFVQFFALHRRQGAGRDPGQLCFTFQLVAAALCEAPVAPSGISLLFWLSISTLSFARSLVSLEVLLLGYYQVDLVKQVSFGWEAGYSQGVLFGLSSRLWE